VNPGDGFRKENVSAGKDCVISPSCSLDNVVLGDGVVIRDGVRLRNAVIGDFTHIARNVTFYSPLAERPIRIGHHCWFSYGVFGEATGGEIQIGDYVVMAHRTTLVTSSGPGPQSPIMNALYPVHCGTVRIGAHCWLCANVVILPDAVFEEGVILGANSLASTGRFDSWSLYAGNPARLLKRLDPAHIQAVRLQLGLETPGEVRPGQ